MTEARENERRSAVLQRDALQGLIEQLAADGYQVCGPTLRDDAIVYDEIAGLADLPTGWTDEQQAGRYRLQRRDDAALFGYAVGPQSWKQYLFPPVEHLWTAQREEQVIRFVQPDQAPPKRAFIGVRSCELHAIAIQDRVFQHGPHVDTAYAARRQNTFIVAVNCGVAGGTCFCVSMQTGPRAESGFDLSLTELLDGQRHEFLVEIGSAAGAALLARLPQRAATQADLDTAAGIIANTASHMGRSLDTDGLRELLRDHPEHPRWDQVAERCLSCANCTMVCPTCFCSTVADHSDLDGATAERVRSWDSCFTLEHSYIHGGVVRQSTKSHYRQWMTHKLSSWIDQFGTSGCVGCGRCVTWCPVGIDITEEAAAMRASVQQEKDR